MRTLLTFFLFYSIILCSGCSSEFPTVRLTSDLREKLTREEFERIYDESSLDLRRSIGKQEFIEKLKKLVAVMRKADPDLNWQVGKANGDAFGKSEGELKFYSAERTIGVDREDVFFYMYFNEEQKGIVKLSFLRVTDYTTKPKSTISIP
jgi:hypothetical protein